jgi:hypothetical protein
MRPNFQSTKNKFLAAYLKETIDFKTSADTNTHPTQDQINKSGAIKEQVNVGSSTVEQST